MSIKAMTYVWEHSKQKGSALLTLLAIADHTDDEGIGYPSIPRIARKTRMTDRNVQLVIKTLQKSGELKVLENQGPKGHHLFHIAMKTFHPEKFSPYDEGATQEITTEIYEEGVKRGEKFSGGVKSFQGEIQCENPAPLLLSPSPHPSLFLSPLVPEPSVSEKTSLTSFESQKVAAPPPESANSAKVKAPRKTPMPTDPDAQEALRLTIVDVELDRWMAKKGLMAFDVEEQWDAFVRKALANAYAYANWRAAFQNWLTSDYQQTLVHGRLPGKLTRAEQRTLDDEESTRQLEDLVHGRDTHNSVWAPPRRDGADLQQKTQRGRQGSLPHGRG